MKGLKRILSLPTPWLVALFVFVAIMGVGGSVIAYQTYDWVEHDNDFCMSCHLMAEPYELFAESAHRDLGCKACHKPTFAARSSMALTQVIQNPDSLTVHAEVPDEKCISCHVEGDPEKWTQIANSAGHRVHFESTDTALADLSCVGCHSSGLHEFTATDQTCAQSGCHTDTEVTLGRMGDLTIHCVACHSFSEPAEGGSVEVAQAAVAPASDACLSCHAMRALVDIPEDEPHEAVCATCHNPHTQQTPAQAGETCANAGCHEEVTELTPFHRGIDHAIDDCMSCHTAHDFSAEGENCLACHTDIFNDAGVGGGRVIAGRVPAPSGTRPTSSDPHTGLTVGFASTSAVSHASPPSVRVAVTPQAAQTAPGADRIFRHASHRDLDCTSCHTTSETHGRLTVDAPTDCASCHHVTSTVSDDCATCHAQVERPGRPDLQATWAMQLSVGVSEERDVPFAHVVHDGTTCATCHTDGLDQPVADDSCAGCHVEHHEQPTVSCISCHETPPDDAHDVNSHLGCGGSGCHTDSPLTVVPRQGREGCLSCHTDLVDHRPEEGACADCHQLPPPRGGGG